MNPTFSSQTNSPFTRHRVAGPTITFPETKAAAKVAPASTLSRVLTAVTASLLSLGPRSSRVSFN